MEPDEDELADAFNDEELDPSIYLPPSFTAQNPPIGTLSNDPRVLLQQVHQARDGSEFTLNPVAPYASLRSLELSTLNSNEEGKSGIDGGTVAIPSPSRLIHLRDGLPMSAPEEIESKDKEEPNSRLNKQADIGSNAVKRPPPSSAAFEDLPPPPAYRPDLGKGSPRALLSDTQQNVVHGNVRLDSNLLHTDEDSKGLISVQVADLLPDISSGKPLDIDERTLRERIESLSLEEPELPSNESETNLAAIGSPNTATSEDDTARKTPESPRIAHRPVEKDMHVMNQLDLGETVSEAAHSSQHINERSRIASDIDPALSFGVSETHQISLDDAPLPPSSSPTMANDPSSKSKEIERDDELFNHEASSGGDESDDGDDDDDASVHELQRPPSRPPLEESTADDSVQSGKNDGETLAKPLQLDEFGELRSSQQDDDEGSDEYGKEPLVEALFSLVESNALVESETRLQIELKESGEDTTLPIDSTTVNRTSVEDETRVTSDLLEARIKVEPNGISPTINATLPPDPVARKDNRRKNMDDDDFLVLSEDRTVHPSRLAQALPTSIAPSQPPQPRLSPIEQQQAEEDRKRLEEEQKQLWLYEQDLRDRQYASKIIPFASLGSSASSSVPSSGGVAASSSSLDLDPESRVRLRQERLEKERISEEKLYQVRRQYEQSSIASARSLDYLKKRRRHQLISRECARRMTFSPNTHMSRLPKAEDEEVEKELKEIPFNDGWRSVLNAFRVGQEEDLIKCSRADEEFNSYLVRSKVRDEATVRDYMMMVLDGSPPSPLVRRVVRLPPEQFDPDEALRVSYFAMGKCLKAMPFVFNSLMSAQLDTYAERRRGHGVTREDAQRLLNTAKSHVENFTTLTMQFLAFRYPLLAKIDLVGEQQQSRRALLLMRECIQNALGEMFFDRGLGLFYYQVLSEEDLKLQKAIEQVASKQLSLVQIAKTFGLNNSAIETEFISHPERETRIVETFRKALLTKLCPMSRLSRLVLAFKCLGEGGLSGDDLLPLVIASIIKTWSSSSSPAAPLRLYSLNQILDDFGLVTKSGEEGFVLSMLMTAAEALVHEDTSSAEQS